VPVIIGTSGWQYDDWRGRLYPRNLAQSKWLAHYAERFQSVEVNNAFYRLPEVSTFERWRDSTPDDFVLSLKASRYLTHVRRLRDPAEPVHRLMERAGSLQSKLGPILIQLPANFRADQPALRRTLEAFPKHVRLAFEPRHESWYQDGTEELLASRNVALCLSDTPERKAPVWRTADWGYLRFHQGRAAPAPCYGRKALHTWAERLATLWSPNDDVFAYFNNDHGGCAVRDAHRFALAASHAGLTATRVPNAREASLTVEPAAS
jgi:uncharacterized protein YecE (DUF72 family)